MKRCSTCLCRSGCDADRMRYSTRSNVGTALNQLRMNFVRRGAALRKLPRRGVPNLITKGFLMKLFITLSFLRPGRCRRAGWLGTG